MRAVICKSGIKGQRILLRESYSSFEEFENYSSLYNLAKRLSYPDAQSAWKFNLVIEYSTNPADFRFVSFSDHIHRERY